MSHDLSHINAEGQAAMVDVSGKPLTHRVAIATGRISMQPETLQKIANHQIKKGEVLAVARIAGIMAAKKTAELIPLCHTINLAQVEVNFALHSPTATQPDAYIDCTAKATTQSSTGVEMEALTAVSVALLTIYDMAKAIDRFMEISQVQLIEKRGGKSDVWKNPNFPSAETTSAQTI